MSTSIKDMIKSWRKDLCPEEGDKLWEKWLVLKDQSEDDLQELITGDFKLSIKARALLILLVPELKLLPFAWKQGDNDSGNCFGSGLPDLRSLPKDVIERAARLVCAIMEAIRQEPKTVSDRREALSYYSYYLLQFMSLLPDGGWIMNYYPLNDPEPFCDESEASGYNPLRNLLGNKDIPEVYKRIADLKMRKIIEGELSGELKPRRDYEDALNCYVAHINLLAYGFSLPYSVSLLAEQIDYIISLPAAVGRRLFSSHNVDPILTLLSRPEYRELRYRFIYFVAFQNGERFCVYDEKTLKAAEKVIAEFGEQYPDLKTIFETAIQESERRAVEEKKKKEEEERRIEKVLSQMKI